MVRSQVMAGSQIARSDVLKQDYAQLRKDLEKALRRLNLWVEETAS